MKFVVRVAGQDYPYPELGDVVAYRSTDYESHFSGLCPDLLRRIGSMALESHWLDSSLREKLIELNLSQHRTKRSLR